MTGNIGEWSELYTMFKLLADGKLYSADADTQRIPDIYYDVLKVIRNQTNDTLEYSRDAEIKVISAATGDILCRVPIARFVQQTQLLLAKLKNPELKNSFEIPEVWTFAESIRCKSLKAKSTDKADIHLLLHDVQIGRNDKFGFSIKSQLGQPSTLLNASNSTNFTYKLTNHLLSSSEKDAFKECSTFANKFQYLADLGTDIEFSYLDQSLFNFNLQMVMLEMPAIVAEMLKLYYQGKAKKVADLTQLVSKSNIITTIDNETLLQHKVKELLANIALGMVPGTKWLGNYEANGGYIIVKDDGDVVCYHVYNHNAFKNYLFKNTRLDTPSSSRHGFGTIYESNDQQYLKLNLQIRFLK